MLWDPLFASMIGIGVAYAAMRKGWSGYWAIGAGWVAAVALGALWNSTVAAGPVRLAVVYLILVAALVTVFHERRLPRPHPPWAPDGGSVLVAAASEHPGG